MKKIVEIFILLSSIIFITGCQPTPEESSVVSKSDGLNEEFIAKPLQTDETILIDIPRPWQVSEERSAGRVKLEANLQTDEIRVGNLPVMEMKNHEISAEELEELVNYFAGEEELYQPQQDIKKDYEDEIASYKNREGVYGDLVLHTVYQSRIDGLEEAAELAPEEEALKKIEEIVFSEKAVDQAWEVVQAASLSEEDMDFLLKKRKQPVFFDADVGQERKAHIEVENHTDALANSSSFRWWMGDTAFNEETVQEWIDRSVAYSDGSNGAYYPTLLEQLNIYQKLLEQERIPQQEGQEQAQAILKDLGIEKMELSQTREALWFPQGTYKNSNIQLTDNQMLTADEEKAETGYEFVYTRGSGGISSGQLRGSIVGDAASGVQAYAPPFPIEKISIVVTESGVKSFFWDGMCEEVGIVAENTKLLAFADIEKRLLDYIYYNYTMMAQPEENKTKFTYTISDLTLGYTYVPAYKNPQNAWLVPAWLVKAREYVDATLENGKAYERGTVEVMVNALDGGLIAYPDS